MYKIRIGTLSCILIIKTGSSIINSSAYPPGRWRQTALEFYRVAKIKELGPWVCRQIPDYLIADQTTITLRNCDCEAGLEVTLEDISLGEPGLVVGHTTVFPNPIAMEIPAGMKLTHTGPSTAELKIPLVPLKVIVQWADYHNQKAHYFFLLAPNEMSSLKCIEINKQAMWFKRSGETSTSHPVKVYFCPAVISHIPREDNSTLILPERQRKPT